MPMKTILRACAAWLASAVLASGAAAQDYGAYTATRFIPFQNPDTTAAPFTGPVQLSFLMMGDTFRVTMDTGSTGVMLPWFRVKGFDPRQAPDSTVGWEFLSSSKLLWVGHWVWRDLQFVDGAGRPLATARVPILAIEREAHCPAYNEATDGPNCPDTTFHAPSAGIAYMGVGFGREHDGQPQGTPDRNALLNIVAIDGRPVPAGAMRSGYIISARGVRVGLTAADTRGFAFSPLTQQLRPDGSRLPRDWAQATVCASVDEAPCATGPALVDTGIDQMYLTVPSSMGVDTVRVPDPSERCRLVRGLANGSRVRVSFQPAAGGPAPSYGFTVGDTTNPTTPSVVITSIDSAAVFVNTGRHLLRAYEVAYDADGGFFGLRPSPSRAAPPAAPVSPCEAR